MKKETVQRHTLKIIAIFFAVSLWFYVLNSEPVQIERKILVNYVLPKGQAIANLPEKEVLIKLKGSKAFIQNVFSNNEKLNVDLNPYYVSSGRSFRVKFYGNEINLPIGVEVLDINPRETDIVLDRQVTMEVPIRLLFIGDSPKERKIKEFELKPKSVAVTGPVEVIRSYSRIESAPINLASLTREEGIISVALPNLDSRLKFVTSPPIVKLIYKTSLSGKVK